MRTAQFVYPGDPVVDAVFMTGKEFVEVYRGGGPGETRISHLDRTTGKWVEDNVITVNEVICDFLQCRGPAGG